eukprot:gene53423-65251_t
MVGGAFCTWLSGDEIWSAGSAPKDTKANEVALCFRLSRKSSRPCVSGAAVELPVFKGSFLQFFTNSILVALVVLGVILWISTKATKRMSLIPHKWQNFFELVVEFLYGQVENIV